MSKTNTIPKVFDAFNRPKIDGIKCSYPGLTQQQFKEECDINTIVNNFCKTGEWSKTGRPATVMPMFGDFSTVPDFLEAQNILAEAQELFEQLPATIRKRFGNNPAEYLAFVDDPKNTEEAITLGIATRRTEDPPKAGNPVSPQ